MNTPGNICRNCNFQYVLDNSNTVIYYYDKQPWFSFGATVCPKCVATARLFYREEHTEYLEYFILHDFGFITEDYPDEGTIKAFEERYDLHTPAEHALTPRLEKEIESTRIFLENTPDEWIIELLHDPAPKLDLPECWA